MTARLSLAQQYEAVNFALTRQRTLARGGSVKGLRGRSTEEYDVERLKAVLKTLNCLIGNETDIKAFLRLPPEGRKAALEKAFLRLPPEERKAALEMAAAHGGAINPASDGPA